MKTLLLAVSLFLLEIPVVHAQTPYFQGKTIRIVTGYPAGDVNDLWPRLIAQHMTKYIPGNPNFVIQNMPGASSMIAANYVFSVAKPDGLTLGWIAPTLYFDQIVGRKEVQYDWSKYSFHRLAVGERTPALHARRYPVQNHRRRAQSQRAAQMRFRRRDWDRLLFSQAAGRNGRRQVYHRARLSRRRADRSRGGKRRDPVPRHDHRIFLCARAVSYLAQKQFRQKHRAVGAQTRSRACRTRRRSTS